VFTLIREFPKTIGDRARGRRPVLVLALRFFVSAEMKYQGKIIHVFDDKSKIENHVRNV